MQRINSESGSYSCFGSRLSGQARCVLSTRVVLASLFPLLLLSGCSLFSPSKPEHIDRGRGSTFSGNASYYADELAGHPMANGEPYKTDRFTAAHRTLPLGTRVRVTNRRNSRQVVVTITDRGPFVSSRILDLSRRAAEKLDIIGEGVAPVQVEVLAGA